MSLLPHLLRVKGHCPSPCFTRHWDLEEHRALQPWFCPGRSWNFACFRRDSPGLFHTECFLQCRHCTELRGAQNPAEINILSSPNRELLAFRNFTHSFLLCLVFPFCSHYLFIRITQTPSQTRWNPILGSISSSSQPTPASPRAPAIPSGWWTSPSKLRE